MPGKMFYKLIAPSLFVVVILAAACGGSDPEFIDPVPEGATPEEVVRIWFEVMESGDSKRMAGLFDPASPAHEMAKTMVFPHVSMSNVVLQPAVLTGDRAEVIAEFDGQMGIPEGSEAEGQVNPPAIHSRSKFTLVRKEGGKWRLTEIRPAD